MNYENYDYLTQTVFWKFGVKGELDEKLEKAMKQNPPADQVNLDLKMVIDRPETKTKDNVEYMFNLDYNTEKGNYYLNSIDGKLIKQDGTFVEQKFNLFNQSGLNLLQMANVMDGRFAYREYQKWDRETGMANKEAGWFFRDTNRVNDEGKPIIRVLNDSVTEFNLMQEIGKIPINLTQKQKNDLAIDLRLGNPGYSRIPMPNNTAEKVELTLHPQKGIAAHTMTGDRVRWKKVEGKVVFDIDKKTKINETTAKVVEKSLETGITGKGSSKKIA